MGGSGSGRPASFMTSKCEDYHAIDLAWLRRKGLLVPGSSSTIRWSRGGHQTGAVTIGVSHQGLQLSYRVCSTGDDWQSISEVIPFTKTRTSFGGSRRWLQCPSCGRACRILYGGTHFRCRNCHGLRYGSQYEPVYANAATRAHRVRERLGHYGSLDEPFPPKPKGMHWTTYKRLEEQDRRCLESWTIGVARWLKLLDDG